MKVIIALSLILGIVNLKAQEKVEITGTYLMQVACNDTYHEEISFVVEPGADKFSGINHAINLTPEQRMSIQAGSKIKIKGEKIPATTKKMTKGDIRKVMYTHINDKTGIPVNCKGIEEIVRKIATEPADKTQPHDHGKLKLKKLEDDDEEVEVTTMAHILVESIEIIK